MKHDDRELVTKEWAEASGFTAKDSDKRYWIWSDRSDKRHDSLHFILELEFAPALKGAAALSLSSSGGVGFGKVFLVMRCDRGYIRQLCEAIYLPWEEPT